MFTAIKWFRDPVEISLYCTQHVHVQYCIVLFYARFNESPGLTNIWPVPDQFIKSGDHCIKMFHCSVQSSQWRKLPLCPLLFEFKILQISILM